MRTKENNHLPPYYTNKLIRDRIDKYLHQISANQAQYRGTDSTDKDIEKLNELNDILKNKIKELDNEFYNTIYL